MFTKVALVHCYPAKVVTSLKDLDAWAVAAGLGGGLFDFDPEPFLPSRPLSGIDLPVAGPLR
jgi:hypothetical protein